MTIPTPAEIAQEVLDPANADKSRAWHRERALQLAEQVATDHGLLETREGDVLLQEARVLLNAIMPVASHWMRHQGAKDDELAHYWVEVQLAVNAITEDMNLADAVLLMLIAESARMVNKLAELGIGE